MRVKGIAFEALLATIVSGAAASAHALPWIEYEDSVTGEVCSVVNAANLELVVLDETGELAGIRGTDVVFLNTFVDADSFVFYQGIEAGYIGFAEDGDGLPSLWWLTNLDEVVNVNEFTGEPTPTDLLPFEFFDVSCDACPFWDEPAECLDSDLDGVVDAFDLCPATSLFTDVDIDGCAFITMHGGGTGIRFCGAVSAVIFPLMFFGLVGMRRRVRAA